MSNITEYDLKQGIYIPNIECCWLYKAYKECGDYKVEEQYLDKLLNGKIDWSFELIENEELINNIQIKEYNKKLYSLDIINVKYTKKFKDKTEEKTTKQLRDWSYINGFSFNNKQFTNWKRSSGKARVGQNLFLISGIVDKCLNWARMSLTFSDKLDVGSVRAYESLPLSSIIGFVEIDPESILVIDDYESVFPWKMSKTWLENGKLKTETSINEECNSIWDGECLLSNKIFDKYDFLQGKGVALLRNRFMKSAGFCTYIEKFYRDYCNEHGYDYETYNVQDMYGNDIKVKDIMLITTPSSIKIKKYNDDSMITNQDYGNEIKPDGKWLKFWKDNCIDMFGVCKTEKPSHHCIFDDKGEVVLHRNVLSYQMVNTIPFTKDELKQLVQPEIQYVEKLKTDLQFFLEEIKQTDNYWEDSEDEDNNDIMTCGDSINVIQAFIELSKKNEDFIKTQVFKDYRRNFVDAYVNKLRQGKIKIDNADYCVACGNPYEMLMATVNKFQGKSLTLYENELYCSRFKDNEDVIGFRNPSINCGNIGVQINRYNDKIHEYFNDTHNIVYLNSIEYPILSTYQGEDFDIDSNLLTTHPIIVQACKRINKDITAIPVNCIKNSGKNNRELTPQNMSDVDHIISQNYIGSTINLSQEINSIMNHAKYNNLLDDKALNELYDMTSKLSSISCCEIDKAKKQFEDLNVPMELDNIKNGMELVDNMRICKVMQDIDNLKQELCTIKKEVQLYRTEERKPYNKRKREISNILNDEELADEEISLLKEELTDIEEVIQDINHKYEDKIDIIKYNISKKHKELSLLDKRRIKPYFFKFVGDNEAKKQRKISNKKHKKMLDKMIIEKFAKEKMISVKDIDLKDKELTKLLKCNNKIQQEWEDDVYRKLDTPMDWLEEEIDKIKNNKKVGTVQVIQLIKTDTHRYNKDKVQNTLFLINKYEQQIKSYKINNEITSKDKIIKINETKKKIINIIKNNRLTKSDLYNVLKNGLTTVKNNGKIQKKSPIENFLLEILFNAYGTTLLKLYQ